MALTNFKNGQVLTETELNNIVKEVNGKAQNTKVTTSQDGLMSKEDKSKLDGIATNANNYTHPNTSGNKHVPTGGSAGQILVWGSDGTAKWGNDKDTTYSAATENSLGLVKKMSTQADSVASDVPGLVADFNALLAKLKSAGLMN